MHGNFTVYTVRYLLHSFFSGDFVLVYWVKEGSVSVLELAKLTGDRSVGSDSQVKLGRTLHLVKIAAVGMCIQYVCVHRLCALAC